MFKKKIRYFKGKTEYAYDRIKKLINNILYVNSRIEEFKKISSDEIVNYFSLYTNTEWYKVKTGLGIRGIQATPFTLKFGEFVDSDCPLHKTVRFEAFYTISITDAGKSVDIYPELTKDSFMNEKQIYDSIVELENIFAKYTFATSTDEHKHNLKKFLNRFIDERC